MTVLEATVLDSMHLELAKPLTLRAGTRVAVRDLDDGSSAPQRPLGYRQREQARRRPHGDLRGYAGQWPVLDVFE